MTARSAAIRDVALLNPKQRVALGEPEALVPFIPMASVREDLGTADEKRRPLIDLRRGYTYFEKGDVLLAKITPCFENGKVAHLDSLSHSFGFGSTEFHVLRAGPELNSRYLYHFVRSPRFRRDGAASMSGSAGQQRVSAEFVARYPMPLPALGEQQRIAAIMDKAESIRRKRKESLQLLDNVLRSAFLEMFGDPVRNEKGWKTLTLGEAIADGPQNGLYRPASDYGSGTPIVRIDSFYDGGVSALQSLRRVRLSAADVFQYGLHEGDVLVNRVNSREFLGKSALVPALDEPIVFESNMIRFRVRKTLLDACYLVALLQTPYFKRQVASRTRDAVNQSSFNQEDLRAFEVRVPPLEPQQHYRRLHERISAARHKLTDAGAHSNLLLQALGQRMFGVESICGRPPER